MKFSILLLGFFVVVGLSAGCFDLSQGLHAGLPAPGDGGIGSGDPQTQPPGNGNDGQPPVVGLTVSNPTPGLNEPVSLVCARVDGVGNSTTFAFQSNTGRLSVDSARGTASFLVDQTDLNTTLRVTCTGTDENGTGNRSNTVSIFPTP